MPNNLDEDIIPANHERRVHDYHSEPENGFWGQCGWVIERTFAWLSTWRRLSTDYEVLPGSEEAWIYIAMIRIMLRRLAQNSS